MPLLQKNSPKGLADRGWGSPGNVVDVHYLNPLTRQKRKPGATETDRQTDGLAEETEHQHNEMSSRIKREGERAEKRNNGRKEEQRWIDKGGKGGGK